MELYHVSFQIYEVGQTYTANNPTGYHLRSIKNGVGWINEKLDILRTLDRPSRISSFYACDQVVNCQAFIGSKTIDSKSPNYYKVEMDCKLGFPMVLIDKIRKIGEDSNELEAIVKEYWTPTKQWKYLEFLSPSMKIIDVLATPEKIMANKGKVNYSCDFEIAKQIFS